MIKKVEIYNICITLCFLLISFAIWHDYKICWSIAIGSAIGGANFWALYRIVTGFAGGSHGKLRFAVFAFLKFFILIFILWAVIKWLPVNAAAFLMGLSTIVLSILLCFVFTRERVY